jgi:hypothetical protein
MANPFKFGAPVQGEQFTGRRREVSDIVNRVTDHVNIVVISPRRFGKTSLMDAACARIARAGGTVARVNAMTANADLGVFASRFVSSIYAAKGPWHKAKQSITSFLASFGQLQPSVSIGTSGPQFSFTAEAVHRDPVGVIGGAYALLATATTPLIFIDEFQELTQLPGNLPGLFKGMADEYGSVSLVVAGSQQHMMRDLTLDARGPLYAMMHAMQLGPIPVQEMGDFVQRRFNIGGKPISRELADKIVAIAGPVPNDIQHLSYDVYAAAASDREIMQADVNDGMQAASEHEASVFADTYANLRVNQRRVLAALADPTSASPQSREFLARTGYANPSGVMRALNSLSDSGVVTLRAGEWVVVSPFLRAWLSQLQQ